MFNEAVVVIVIVILLEWRELRELKFPDHWSKRFVKHYANAIRDHASEVIPLALTPVNNSQKYIFRFAKETKKLIRYLDGFFPRINKLYTFLIFIIILSVMLPPGAPSPAEKKLADFGTSNNIATSVFNSLINRTKMFLVSYYNLSNN